MSGKFDSFPFEVKGREDLPEAFQNIFSHILAQDPPLRAAVYAPPMDLLAEEDKKYFGTYLVILFDDRLVIAVEKEGVPPEPVEIPINEIICIEAGSVLLYSWFQIYFGREECKEIKVLYNTVGGELFRKIVFLLRKRLDNSEAVEFKGAIEPELPLKFQNELNHWLFPGEKMIGYAFQPEIARSYLWFLKKPIAPPLLAAVTTRQILLITEIKPVLRVSFGRYSEIYIYCPPKRVESAKTKVIEATPHLEHLTLMLTIGEARHSTNHLIHAENAEKFRALCALMYKR
jgi:hypothetical protein